MDKIKRDYGVALLAAPLFVLAYNLLFQNQLINEHPLKNYTIEALLLLVLFYPIAEEIIFRGMLQEYILLKSKKQMIFMSISTANLLTSILFVVLHVIYHEVYWALLVFIPSLIFGYFKDRFQSIIPSIILHSFYNVCSLFLLL